MKKAALYHLCVFASALLLTACASQAPVQQAAPVPAAAAATPTDAATPTGTAAAPTATAVTSKAAGTTPTVSVVASTDRGTRRLVKDGVEYFCERPAATGSHFIATREQCYTAEQLKAVRERDQEFLRRQQDHAAQTGTTAVTKTPMSP